MENKPSPAPLHQVVGQLRELLSNGTPGPWKYADHVGEGTAIALIGNTFVVGPPCMAVIDEVPDCALIVAAVNALPALLEIAEAASTAAHHWQRACQAEPGAGRIADNAMAELQSALSLLPNTVIACGPDSEQRSPSQTNSDGEAR